MEAAARTLFMGLNPEVRVDASGSKTQAIFDDVFSKLVEAAQPIPGFKRLKGGIMSHFAMLQEGLKVSKDLRVEQSYEELEQIFVPGKEFGFDAAIQLQENKKMQI
ncbi:uncharacterized protein A4U43_C04F19850 [Asparagus officinalis]|uniref:Uncharacterized protein n=1 Tax=Asparagus officinalis TaxID=4686 RepID=A0A5P1F2A1_ASPOF|nr:uncharacterized protein A4U43_C04F19850 [Asparagus officinalis]